MKNPNLQSGSATKQSYYYTKVRPKLDLIEGWARNGLSDKQICTNLGVGNTNFDRYVRDYEDLQEALARGRQDSEVIVENALFKRATGYKYKEYTKELKNDELILTKVVLKESACDVGAAIYWLENRAPKRWAKEQWRIDLEKKKLELLEKKLSLVAKDFGYDSDDSDDGFLSALKKAAGEVWLEES